MEHKLRKVWWFVLFLLVVFAIWRLFLPHGSNAYLQKTAASREIVVYVAGAVEAPGLVHLAPDARLDDALKQVKLLPEANLESMNPAEKLKDGQKITVPYKNLSILGSGGAGNSQVGVGGSSGSGGSSVAATNGAGAVSPNSSLNAGGAGAGRVSSTSDGGKININTAGAAELDKLPGVGPALAGRIVQYRTDHGPFSQPEDLQNVSGIGAKTYEKMASQVTVGP
ncbi:competence protein ComEA-like protein with helix-hairpin-helix repeat region [Desulfosporosinus acidiphilus SJ4]|uniref:Competence protein ComEA-like protein with helix-hairpin-helix repeat region n=1 Tax=Desulfosporosinus acidiphilus (strain DSM 22704 / JCM 16185 / SJ4) TaxID=646529 RepID=I4DAT7_DESAJ|nr:helix-hairpin-helix domain-containing protein [Desulfosporosinus acidiphilus]AFM42911.1 competence protein ComEA-like protein with helix-hairpin-helix repeat region [Desulfosporosinus acidiphilus SJ4]